jgi:hypothetical protein
LGKPRGRNKMGEFLGPETLGNHGTSPFLAASWGKWWSLPWVSLWFSQKLCGKHDGVQEWKWGNRKWDGINYSSIAQIPEMNQLTMKLLETKHQNILANFQRWYIKVLFPAKCWKWFIFMVNDILMLTQW